MTAASGLLALAAGSPRHEALGQEPASAAKPFSFERLIERSRALAAEAFAAPPRVPDALGEIPLETWERLALKDEATIWRDGPAWRLGLYFPGSVHREPVAVNVVEDGQARPVVMRPDMFDLGALDRLRDQVPAELGFAGLKVLYPIADAQRFDELLTFLGASYFRAVARGTNLGAAARGLALDTGLGRAEEFPGFREFWVQRPGQPFDPLTIFALLDSPRVAGAFRFDVVVREQTRIAVDANLFFRANVEQVGVAPVSGMYLFGTADRVGVDDYRQAAHGVDGLMVWSGTGEILWRPVTNPTELRMSILVDDNPRGFGLLQRQRDPMAFADAMARFDRRPNLWVEPRGTWGKGSVRLIEVPTATEANQNIAAFWTPAEPVRAGQELRLAYSLIWSEPVPLDLGLASVRATRVGAARHPDGTVRDGVRQVVLDFAPSADASTLDPATLDVQLTGSNATLSPAMVERNPLDDGWRVSFAVERRGTPVELRATLRAGERAVSETWLFRLDQS